LHAIICNVIYSILYRYITVHQQRYTQFRLRLNRLRACRLSRRKVPDPHAMAMRSVIGRHSSPVVVDRRHRYWPPYIRSHRCPECAKKKCLGRTSGWILSRDLTARGAELGWYTKPRDEPSLHANTTLPRPVARHVSRAWHPLPIHSESVSRRR